MPCVCRWASFITVHPRQYLCLWSVWSLSPRRTGRRPTLVWWNGENNLSTVLDRCHISQRVLPLCLCDGFDRTRSDAETVMETFDQSEDFVAACGWNEEPSCGDSLEVQRDPDGSFEVDLTSPGRWRRAGGCMWKSQKAAVTSVSSSISRTYRRATGNRGPLFSPQLTHIPPTIYPQTHPYSSTGIIPAPGLLRFTLIKGEVRWLSLFSHCQQMPWQQPKQSEAASEPTFPLSDHLTGLRLTQFNDFSPFLQWLIRCVELWK